MSRLIVDTGPFVAYLRESDRHHAWVRRQFQCFPPPYWTCEPVMTEALFLLNRFGGKRGADILLGWLERGILRTDFALAGESSRLRVLLSQYADVPMSLADACLVRMAEINAGSTVATIDSDFHIYRKNGREAIPLLMPDYGANNLA